MLNRNTIITLITALSLAVPFSTQAQAVLEEIVVTAEYREENLQEVPVAVTAFSADEITRAGTPKTPKPHMLLTYSVYRNKELKEVL